MPLMDEFQNERNSIKDRPFKEKLVYFWDYYKWWVVAGICLLIAIISTVHSVLTRKDNALYLALINIYEKTEEQSLGDDFLTAHGIDTKKNTILFDDDLAVSLENNSTSNYTNLQKITVYLMAGDLDLMVSNQEVFGMYAYQDVFKDLRNIFSEEELTALEGRIYYFDLDWYEKYNEDDITYNDIYDELPDPMKPETMGRPVPIAIDISNSKNYTENFYTSDEDTAGIVVGILGNTKNAALAEDFLRLLAE